MIKKIIRHAKMEYFGSKFNKFINDTKQTWKTIKEVLNKCKSKTEFPKYFVVNGVKLSSNEEIAGHFNEYFVNIGPKLSQNIKITSAKTIDNFLKRSVSSTFSFELVDTEYVKKKLFLNSNQRVVLDLTNYLQH